MYVGYYDPAMASLYCPQTHDTILVCLGFYNKNIFPFENYSFHNVSCNTRIYAGATLKAWCQLYMASTFTFVAKDMIMIGSWGLFQLTSGYIDKSIKETTSNLGTNTNYASSNLNQTVKDILDIHGNFTDNTISIEKNIFFELLFVV